MAQYTILKKEDLGDFLARLARKQRLVAPVARGYNNYAFQDVTLGEEVALRYIPTILPPKKYFMPQTEKLVDFDLGKNSYDAVVEHEKMTIFGVHTCDLAGIQCLNIIFNDKPRDPVYLMRKNTIAIIGLECNEYCDEHASCKVMDNHMPNGGYDLFFTELEKVFMIHVNTLLGEEIVEYSKLFGEPGEEHRRELEALRERKRKEFKDEVGVSHQGLKGLFDGAFDDPVWEELGRKCVSCGNCTNVCPTCYCFDVIDELELDLKSGTRHRQWDSCQNETFATVAGGESFREERGSRQRHRYMRKFQYPVDKFRRYFCTGCGRCSRTCMAGIRLKETINKLAERRS